MKNGPFTPNPGDLFTWHYDSDDTAVTFYTDEKIWSSSMKRYVPASGINLLISLTDTDIWWMNEGRFIHACVNEYSPTTTAFGKQFLHPRKLNEDRSFYT